MRPSLKVFETTPETGTPPTFSSTGVVGNLAMAGGNLFRSIGFGLIIMGIYPLIQPKEIKKEYGYIIIAVGLIKLWNGFSDLNTPITDLYSLLYSELGILISLMVILALSYVILAIAKESIDIVHGT